MSDPDKVLRSRPKKPRHVVMTPRSMGDVHAAADLATRVCGVPNPLICGENNDDHQFVRSERRAEREGKRTREMRKVRFLMLNIIF